MILPFDRSKYAGFANHLCFLGRHRGRRRADEDAIWIDGVTRELSSWTPLTPLRAVADDVPGVRPGPWAHEDEIAALQGAGYRPVLRVSYMERDRHHVPQPVSVAASIDVVRSADAACAFAAVQAEGFADGDADANAWWAAHFADAAQRNRLDPQQTLYLARVDGEPAACALLLRDAGVAGIHAVATRPAFRRRGLAQALLERACADAATQYDLHRVILQAISGSHAESYYTHLGFRCHYRLALWQRP